MNRKLALIFGASMVAAAGLGFAAGQSGKGEMHPADAFDWQPLRPDSPIDMVVLWGDPSSGEHGRLIKLPAGFEAPIHAHSGDYHGINLTGMWRHSFDDTGEARTMPPGSYVFQPGEKMHGDACVGSEDCILFLHQKVAADFIPKE